MSCFASSCGGAGPAPPSVTVNPNSAQPPIGTPVQFSASVANVMNTAVTWEVNGVPGGGPMAGTIDATGKYTAPNQIPSPATVTVSAALQSDPSIDGTASVTVEPPVSIQGPLTIAPSLSSVTTSQTVQLQMTTPGVTNTQVHWSVDGVPNGNATVGMISASGLFTPGQAGSHLVTAALQANPAVLGSAQVKVTALAGVFTWRDDNSRSGENVQELALAPSNVSSSTFGKLFSCPVDGQVYAQPLYVANLPIPGMGMHNVVFVATENDSVFAFDADASPCEQLWQTPLIPATCQMAGCTGEQAVPMPNLQITSSVIAPFVGITGTPVIDPSSSTLYVVAKTQVYCEIVAPTCEGLINPTYNQRLFALDLGSGQPKIQPSGVLILTPANVSPAFSSMLENQRAGLLLDDGNVYVAFGSLGDQGTYHGWIFAYSAASLTQSAFFDVTGTGGALYGGIWMSGGGPSADAAHNVYAVTGSGPFNAGQNYGDSFVKLSPALSVSDSFTPCDQATMASTDADLGASAAVLVNTTWSASFPDVMIGAGKNGALYVVDRDALGGYDGGVCPDTSPHPVQKLAVGSTILSSPLFWNGQVYAVPGAGALETFPVSHGLLVSSAAQQSPETLGTQGATPVVSASGTNNGIIWLIDTSGAYASPNTAAVLRAYDATNLSNEIYNSATNAARDSAGLAIKFTVPVVANAKVYVGAASAANPVLGELDVYGFLPQ